MSSPVSFPGSSSVPSGDAPLALAAILATQELATRPSREPDHAPESRALRAMALGLERSPIEALEALMREAVESCGGATAAGAGVSLLERDEAGREQFRWVAVAGRVADQAGRVLSRDASFCGVCLDANEPALLRMPTRQNGRVVATGDLDELLVVPLCVGSEPLGSVWVAHYEESRPFDREDLRFLQNLASAAASICAMMRAQALSRAEHAQLALSEARFRAVQQASPDAQLLCRAVRDEAGALIDFRIVYANPASHAVLHSDGGALEGRSLRESFPRAASRGRIEVYARVVATGEPLREETVFEENGQQRCLRVTAVRIDDGVHIAFTDLTDRLESAAERERLLQNAEAARCAAEQANRAKGQFLAAMSHELRTPLNAIAGYVELLQMGLRGPTTPAQHDALDRIAHNQRHLLRLVNDVLNFSRLEAGRVEYHMEAVRLSDVVREIAPMVEPQIAAKGLAFAVEVAADRVVLADREKLKQVFVNLLSNAAKFTAPGGRVRLSCPRRDDGTHPDGVAFIAVRDTGIGIPSDRLEQVFEPFVQVDTSASRRAAGAGLGLAISRDLVRGMGGELRARSEEGRGSTFTVALREAAEFGLTV